MNATLSTWTHRSEARGAAPKARSVARDTNLLVGVVLACVFVTTLPALAAVIALTRPAPPAPKWSAEAALLGVNRVDIAAGEITYRRTCALCHGPNAEGVERLGKPLRNSAFVQQHSDEELLSLIANGRFPTDPENTTGALMPARGGGQIGDDRLAQVVTFLRAIQEPGQPTVSVEAWVVRDINGDASAGSLVAGAAGVGHNLFVASCSACHGAAGQGMEGLGKPLNTSAFVSSKSDDELIRFIKTGRPIWDPENTTGLDMPSKGGNPALTDEQLADIVTYIRSLHK